MTFGLALTFSDTRRAICSMSCFVITPLPLKLYALKQKYCDEMEGLPTKKTTYRVIAMERNSSMADAVHPKLTRKLF